MIIARNFIILALIAFLSACFSSNEKERQAPPREIYANEEGAISLIEPKTRVVVRCYSNEYQPAEFCAQQFEGKGYVRFKNIPQQPAKYDFLKKDTFPTRRWRDGEVNPRW